MTATEIALVIVLAIGIVALLIITARVRKGIEETIYTKFKNLEQDTNFINKVNHLKKEIDDVNQISFNYKISSSKEYFINDAIRRSGAVTKGKVIEHFAPFLISEIFNPDEIIFMGSPIDLISFTNIDNSKELSIDFLEIKSGNSTLNKKQKLIRDAIYSRRVFYKKVMLK